MKAQQYRVTQLHIGAPVQAPHPVLHFLPQVHNPAPVDVYGNRTGDAPPIDLSRATGVVIGPGQTGAPPTPRVKVTNVHRPSVRPLSLPILGKPQANGVPRQITRAANPGGTTGQPAKLVVGKRLGRA